jgi:hypothetical protein
MRQLLSLMLIDETPVMIAEDDDDAECGEWRVDFAPPALQD